MFILVLNLSKIFRSSFSNFTLFGIFPWQFLIVKAVTLWHKLPKLLAKSLFIQSSSLSFEILPSFPKETSLIK